MRELLDSNTDTNGSIESSYRGYPKGSNELEENFKNEEQKDLQEHSFLLCDDAHFNKKEEEKKRKTRRTEKKV